MNVQINNSISVWQVQLTDKNNGNVSCSYNLYLQLQEGPRHVQQLCTVNPHLSTVCSNVSLQFYYSFDRAHTKCNGENYNCHWGKNGTCRVAMMEEGAVLRYRSIRFPSSACYTSSTLTCTVNVKQLRRAVYRAVSDMLQSDRSGKIIETSSSNIYIPLELVCIHSRNILSDRIDSYSSRNEKSNNHPPTQLEGRYPTIIEPNEMAQSIKLQKP